MLCIRELIPLIEVKYMWRNARHALVVGAISLSALSVSASSASASANVVRTSTVASIQRLAIEGQGKLSAMPFAAKECKTLPTAAIKRKDPRDPEMCELAQYSYIAAWVALGYAYSYLNAQANWVADCIAKPEAQPDPETYCATAYSDYQDAYDNVVTAETFLMLAAINMSYWCETPGGQS